MEVPSEPSFLTSLYPLLSHNFLLTIEYGARESKTAIDTSPKLDSNFFYIVLTNKICMYSAVSET